MECGCSLPCSQKLIAGSYPETAEYSLPHQILVYNVTISSSLSHGLVC